MKELLEVLVDSTRTAPRLGRPGALLVLLCLFVIFAAVPAALAHAAEEPSFPTPSATATLPTPDVGSQQLAADPIDPTPTPTASEPATPVPSPTWDLGGEQSPTATPTTTATTDPDPSVTTTTQPAPSSTQPPTDSPTSTNTVAPPATPTASLVVPRVFDVAPPAAVPAGVPAQTLPMRATTPTTSSSSTSRSGSATSHPSVALDAAPGTTSALSAAAASTTPLAADTSGLPSTGAAGTFQWSVIGVGLVFMGVVTTIVERRTRGLHRN